ncbi:MAG: hypothetical protein LAQ69_05645 [Acidobacteriia bacterium]|nr:hypothetical protein [Terriglobia bacterium]
MFVPKPIPPSRQNAAAGDLLETWKEIAAYLNRDLRTVKRWESTRGLPVHRLPGGPQAAVYALKSEVDAWRRGAEPAAEAPGSPVGKRHRIPWAAAAALLAAAAIVIVYPWRSTRKPAPRVTNLTTYRGVEWYPAFSPDGKQIAFSWNGEHEDNFDIYVKLVDVGNPIRLTTDSAMDLAPAWSPDGRYIAFFRWRLGEAKTERLIVPAMGGPERRVAEGSIRPSATGLFFPIHAWTPDGTRLIGGGSTPTVAYRLGLLSTCTGESRPLTEPPAGSPGDCCPAVSPSGRTLAFLRASPARSYKPFLLDIRPNGEPLGPPRPLEVPSCSNPMWSGNGSELLCLAGDGGEQTLWRIPISGARSPEPLPSIGALGRHLAISPRGDRLVYSNFSWEGDIWQLSLSGHEPATRQIASTADDLQPRFSPDGKRIAFLSNRTGHLAIWVADRNGANASELAAAAAQDAPAWSPDGQHIAYTCRIGGNAEDVCLIGSSGGTPRRLTTETARDILPGWSRDGRWVYFASDRSGAFQTWKMAADGSAPAVQVTRNGGFGGIESTDGRFLYYARTILSGPIWRVPVQGGEEVPLGDEVRSLRLPQNFAVDEDGIVFAASDNPMQSFEIRRYSLLTRNTKVIARIKGGFGNGISLSPDGQTLLYTTAEMHSGDLMMVENFR